MNSKIKAIVFDFGGTLDTNGVHWAEKFWEAYTHFQISIPKEEFRNAFVYSERKISGIIKQDFSLLKTYQTQITYQLEYLVNNKLLLDIDERKTVTELSNYCYQSILKNMPTTKNILNKLKNNFTLGLVSNYYGNVKTVLTGLSLVEYFNIIIDSTIVGIRKPDSRIFKHIINEIDIKPEEVIVVGDSYKNDITPAKLLGCKTVWLKVKGWIDTNKSENADVTIESLNELMLAINNLFLDNTYKKDLKIN